jgi:TolB-like protein
MSIFTELKRRNVFKVGAAYLVTAWLLLQLVSVVAPILALPGWFARGILLLLAVGFPVALLLAWAFELTPDGIKPTSEVAPGQSITGQTGQKLKTYAIVVLILALALVVVDAYVLNQDSVAEVAASVTAEPSADTAVAGSELERSIAVLPFANLSSDPEQEYFSDGLSEEILNKLAQVQELQVAARTSSFYFKGRNEDMRNIGEQLGVAYLLEGSVRKGGEQLRITAQLIQADNGFHLWSATFDRQLADVFAIQDEIAEAVSTALRITLGTDVFSLPGSTNKVQAYEAFLQAKAIWDRGDPDTTPDVIRLLEQAVAFDPDYAQAWITLSQRYNQQFNLGPVGEQSQNRLKRDEAREKAIALAPEMPLIKIQQIDNSNQTAALANIEALMLELLAESRGNNAEVNFYYAQFLVTVGRYRQALPYAEQALRLDPLNTNNHRLLALTLNQLGRHDEAEQAVLRGLEVAGGRGLTLPVIGWMAAWLKGGNEALVARMLAETPEDSQLQVDIFHRHIAQLILDGDNETAIAELLRMYRDPETPPAYQDNIRQYLVVFEGFDEAMDLLLESKRFPGGLLHIPLRSLPRFKDVLRDTRELDYWRTTGNWPDYCRPLPNTDNDFECF